MSGLSNSARAGIAWGVIVAIVAMAMVLQSLRASPAGQATASPASRMQFTSTARTTIGMDRIIPGSGEASLRTVDWFARTDELKVQAAIVAGEIAGNDVALERLNALKQSASEEIARDAADLQVAIVFGIEGITPEERQRLIDRHGFFGELAMTWGLPDTDPLRARLLAECRRSAIMLLAVEGLGALAALGGLILLIIAAVFWYEGRLRPAYFPRTDDDPVWLEAFAVFLVVQVMASMIVHLLPGGSSLLVSWIVTAPLGLLAVIGWARLRNVGGAEIRYALGLHRGRGWLAEAGMGVVGYIAGLPVIVAGFLITLLLIRFSPTPPSHPLLGEPTTSTVHILLMYFLASIGAPVVEEIVFRGALFHHLRRRWNWLVTAVLVAFIFAAIHPQGWTTVPALGAIAIVLAGIREWRGSIVGPIVAHGLSNGLVYSLSLLVR